MGASSVISIDTASFLLRAPAGWKFDCEAGKGQGPLTVLYRRTESWTNGEAVMYVSALSEGGSRQRSFASRVDSEVAEWQGKARGARVTRLPALPIAGGASEAVVRRFDSPAEHLVEVVAYVPRGRVTPLVAMTARSDRAFDRALPAFRALVRSYMPAQLKIVR